MIDLTVAAEKVLLDSVLLFKKKLPFSENQGVGT